MGTYIKRWLSMAFWHSLGPIDFWTGTASAMLGVVDHYAPKMQLMTTFAWQIPLWACAAIVLVRFALAPYWISQEDAKKIAELEGKLLTRAKLSVIGPDLYSVPPTNYWRISIRNDSIIAAKNVTVKLLKIDPRPQYGTWRSDYPYPVNRVVASNLECKINPHDHADFELLSGWPNGEGQMFTNGLDTKAVGHKNYIGIIPDEHWTLDYEITSENADSVQFKVIVSVQNKSIIMERI